MTRYELLQHAYVGCSERDVARLRRLNDETRVATATMLCMLIERVREHLGRPGDTGVVYFVDPETGKAEPDDDVFNDLVPECVPKHGNGFHVRLNIKVTWPVEDKRRYASAISSELEVIPLRPNRWTISFEGRQDHEPYGPITIDAEDPATFIAFADALFNAVRTFLDSYALPPDAGARPTLGFLRRV